MSKFVHFEKTATSAAARMQHEYRQRPSTRVVLAIAVVVAAAILSLPTKADPVQSAPSFQSERLQIEASVRSLLGIARKGMPFTNPRGAKRIPIMVRGEQVGGLWEDVEFRTLQPGNFWLSGGGQHIELLLNDRVVGVIRINHD